MFTYAYFSRRVEQTLGALTLTALANMMWWTAPAPGDESP
jgi:hypothetical protein